MNRLSFFSFAVVIAGLGLVITASNGAAQPIIEYEFSDPDRPGLNTGSLTNLADGQFVNAIRVLENAPLGQGGAAEFNGVDSYIRVPNAFTYGGELTVEAWIKPEKLEGQLVIWDDYGNPGVLLAVKAGMVQFGISTSQHPGPGIAVLAGQLQTNVWQHVAGVYDGQTLRVFVNGVDSGVTEPTSGDIQENGSAPAIGSDNVSTTALNYQGQIDDFRIYTRALGVEDLAGGIFARLEIEKLRPGWVQIYWAKTRVPYRLQEFNLKDNSWRDVPEVPVFADGLLWVTNDTRASMGLYRLVTP
jgi:hypothetical protein